MKTFGELVLEHFNVDDKETLRVLTSVNEEDQGEILKSLTNKLYNAIVDKVDDIDFGNIPATRGDITKLQNYEDLVDCVQLIKEIVLHYHQDPKTVQEVIDAIENIKDRVYLFEKIFAVDLDFGKTIYNTMVLACVSSISFLISTSIEYVKNGNTFDIALDKVAYVKTKDALLLKNLSHFNTSCRNGNLDKSLNYLLDSSKKNLVGSMSVGLVVVSSIIVITSVIPFIRELIYFFYLTRQNISDYFMIQADLLQMNAANIQYNDHDLSEPEAAKIADKQRKIAEKFRKISNFFNVKIKKTEKDTEREIKSDSKKYNIDDVVDELPDSAGTGSIF